MDNNNSKLINLLHSSMYQNPFATYKRLQLHHPVCQIKPNGIWAISLYHDVHYALTHPELFSSVGVASTLVPDWLPPALPPDDYIIVFEDKPEHTQHRALISSYFKHKTITEFEPDIHEVAQALIDKIQPNSEIDFLASVAYPFAENTINKLIGIDHNERYKKLHKWASMIEMPPLEPDSQYIDQLNEITKEISEYFNKLIQSHRQCPKTGLINHLVNNKTLNNGIIIKLIEIILRGSIQPVAHLISHAIIRLAYDKELVKQLNSTPEKIEPFIDELLRYDSPSHIIARRTRSEVVLSGVTIPKNSYVFLILAAANRDPEQFSNPDTFDISRHNNKKHLSLGLGIHRCMGEALVKVETISIVKTLLKRFPNVTCPPVNHLPWFYRFTTHSVSSLPVTFS